MDLPAFFSSSLSRETLPNEPQCCDTVVLGLFFSAKTPEPFRF
jgi:hypothetical protein